MKDLIVHLVVAAVPGFTVTGFGAAIVGGVLLALFNLVASSILHRRR